MPNRILREGILTSPRIAKLGWAEEVFYRRLHSVVDDFGRYFADQGMLRAVCYPRQLNKVSDSDIGKWLRACEDAALVRVYPAKDGESYLELLDFKQQVRAKESKFPNPLSSCVAGAKHPQSNAHLDVFVSEDVSVLAPNGACPPDGEPAPRSGYAVPDCPHQTIVDLYHEKLPTLPRVEVWSEARKSHLRARWREVCSEQKLSAPDGVAWFADFFALVGQSLFLTGRAPPQPGKRPWNADLEWLINPQNFVKVIEGKYRNELR